MYLEGQLTTEQAAALEAELESPEGKARLEEHRKFLEVLRAPAPEGEDIDLVPSVRKKLERQALGSGRVWWGALAAVAAVVVGVAVYPGREEFRSKSGGVEHRDRWTGIQTFELGQKGQAIPSDGSVDAKSPLMFRYTNASAQPYSHLMIFGVDATGEVRWYYPAYVDPNTNPAALSINDKARLLSDEISHPLPPGQMVVHGLFLRNAVSVKDVEARVLEARKAGVPFEIDGAFDHQTKVTVQ